jgi:hypothetical protein
MGSVTMSIKNADDIIEALKITEEENTDYPEQVKELMISSEFNRSFQIIEAQLDELYEKIRLLEDIDIFCRDYVTKKITEKESKLKETLKIIGDLSSVHEDKSSVFEIVPFVNIDSEVLDRDGAPISTMAVKNKKLEAENNIMSEATFSRISFRTNSTCYNNSYDNLKSGSPGVSFYSLPEPLKDGIEETMNILLSSPCECNYLSIQPANCEIEEAYIIDKNKTKVKVLTNGYFAPMIASEIELRIKATNYVMDSKIADTKTYDSSWILGTYSFDTDIEEKTLKQIELSLAEAEKNFFDSKLETECDTWKRINDDIHRKNVILGSDGQ